MTRLRKRTQRALHQPWCAVTSDWVPEVPANRFWFYALRYGVGHMLAAGETEQARSRLSDLMFTGAYLDWCYTALSDDFSPLLKLWRALGASEEARAYYAQAVERLELTEAERLIWLRHVVEYLRDVGWRQEAIDAAQAALRIHTDLVGPEHPGTAASKNQLALALKAAKRVDEAIPLATDALAVQRRHFSRDDPKLYVTVNSLASMLNAAKRYDESEVLFREAIENRSRLLGADHPKTLISIASFAFMLTKMGKHQESEPFHRQVVEQRSEILGELHPKTLHSCSNLGLCLTELNRLDEALPLLEGAVKQLNAVLGPDHPRTKTATKRLESCLAKRGST